VTYASGGDSGGGGLGIDLGARATQRSEAEATQAIELQRRMNLINDATQINGRTEVDPNLAYQLAQQPISDEDLVLQTFDAMGEQGVQDMVDNFKEQYPEEVQAAAFNSLPAETRRQFTNAGFNPVEGTPDTGGGGFEVFGHSLGPVSDVAGAVAAGAGEAVDTLAGVGGAALHGLNVAADFVPHAFRALEIDPSDPNVAAQMLVAPEMLPVTSERQQGEQSNARHSILDAQLRTELANRRGEEIPDEDWNSYAQSVWAPDAHNDSQLMERPTSGVRLDPNEEAWLAGRAESLSRLPEYGDDFWSRFETTATGSQYVQPVDRLDALGRLNGDWGQLDLAMRLSSGESMRDIVAERVPDQNSQEYLDTFQHLVQMQNEGNFAEVASDLAAQRVTIGRTFADSVGLTPDFGPSWGFISPYNVVSGGADLAVGIFADPTLVAGKLWHTAQAARLAWTTIESATRGVQTTRALSLLDELDQGRRVILRGSATAESAFVAEAVDRGIYRQVAETVYRGRNSANPARRALWADQAHIAQGRMRAAEHFARANRFLDGAPVNEVAEWRRFDQDVLARMPGNSRMVSALHDVHRYDDAIGIERGGRGLATGDDVLDYVATNPGYQLLINGATARHVNRFTMFPRMTANVEAGRGLRRLTRVTLDEIYDATRTVTPFRRTRERVLGGTRFQPTRPPETPDELLRTQHAVEFDGALGSIVEGMARTPMAGVAAKWASRTMNTLSFRTPFHNGMVLAGNDVADEARAVYRLSLLGKHGVSTAEYDAGLTHFLTGLERQDPIRALGDVARQAGFSPDDVGRLMGQAETDGVPATVRALRDTAEEGSEAWVHLDTWGEGLLAAPPPVNVGVRREILRNYWYTVFDRAGMLDPANVKGQAVADGMLRHIGGEQYASLGMDTYWTGTQSRQMGILPLAHHSAMTGFPDFKDMIRATGRGDALRSAWGVANHDWVTGFMNSYWKPAMLLRVAFIPRAAGEELLSYLVRDGFFNYGRMQLALAAKRSDEEALLPIRAMRYPFTIPSRALRVAGRDVRKMMRSIAETGEGQAARVAQLQMMDEMNDLQRISEKAAEIRGDVARWYHGGDRPGSYAQGLRERILEEGYVSPMRRFGEEIGTREMRLASMGPFELMAHYYTGMMSRNIRGRLAAHIDDGLLYSAWSVLQGPGRTAYLESGIGSAGLRRSGLRDIGANDEVIRQVRADVDPTVSSPTRLRPTGHFADIGLDDSSDIETLRLLGDQYRLMRSDPTVDDAFAATAGWFSPEEQDHLMLLTSQSSLAGKTVDLLDPIPTEMVDRVAQTLPSGSLNGIIDGQVLDSDGNLAQWFVDEYDDIVSQTSAGVRAGLIDDTPAVSMLNTLRTRVEFARSGNLAWFPGETMTFGDINRVLSEMSRRASTWEQRQAVKTLREKVGSSGRWVSPEERDRIIGHYEDEMASWDDEAAHVAQSGRLRRTDDGDFILDDQRDAQAFADSMLPPEGDDAQYMYRVVSEEDWRRIEQQGYLDTDGRENLDGTTNVHLSAVPELRYAVDPDGNRLLRIKVDQQADDIAPLADEEGEVIDESVSTATAEITTDNITASEPFVLENPDQWLDPENPPVGAAIKLADPPAQENLPVLNEGEVEPPPPLEAGEPVPEAELEEPVPITEDMDMGDGMLSGSPMPGVEVDEDTLAQARRLAEFRKRGMQQDNLITPDQAMQQDWLDELFTRQADDLYPGWDSQSGNVSEFFRGRSDEILDAPVTSTIDQGPEVAMQVAETIRSRIAAFPDEVQEGIRRLFQGTHNLPPGKRSEPLIDQLRLILDQGEDDAYLTHLLRDVSEQDEGGVLFETLELLWRLPPHTAYLLSNPKLPLWTATQDELRDRLIASTMQTLGDPHVAQFGRDFPWWHQTPEGYQVARPLAENQSRYHTVMGNRSLLDSLTADGEDIDDFLKQISRTNVLQADEEAFLRQVMEDLIDGQELDAALRTNRLTQAGAMLPITRAVSTDADLVRRTNQILKDWADRRWAMAEENGLPLEEAALHGMGSRDFWDTDRVGLPFGLHEETREVGTRGEQITETVQNVEARPAGGRSVFRMDPIIHPLQPWDPNAPVKRFSDGTLVPGVDASSALQSQAETLADNFIHHFVSPKGELLHQVTDSLHQGDFSIDVLRRAGLNNLPQHFVSPTYEVVKDHFWDKVSRFGFDGVIGPAIESIVREPMYLANYHRTLTDLRAAAKDLYRYAGDDAMRNFIAQRPGIESLDELEIVVNDLPAQLTEGANLVDMGTWRAMRSRYDNPEALRFYDRHRVAYQTEGEDAYHWEIAKGRGGRNTGETIDVDEPMRDLITQVHDDDGVTSVISQEILRRSWGQMQRGARDNPLAVELARIADSAGVDSEALVRAIERNGGDVAATQLLVEHEMARYRWNRMVDPDYGEPVLHPGSPEQLLRQMDATLGFLHPYAPQFRSEIDKAREELQDLHESLDWLLKNRAGGVDHGDQIDQVYAQASEVLARVRPQLDAIESDAAASMAINEMGPNYRRLIPQGGRPAPLVKRFPREANDGRPIRRRNHAIREGDPIPRADRLGEVDGQQLAELFKWRARRRAVNAHLEKQAGVGAVADTVPYIDDSARRSLFQDYITHLSPFYFAQEQFIRRWAMTFRHTPEGVRKLQLGYQGLESTGLVQTDDFGEDYMVMPIPDVFSNLLGEIPVFQHFFGTGAAVPSVLEVGSQLRFALPGFSNPTELPGMGPLGGVAMTWAANRWPWLEGLEDRMLGPRGVDRTLWETIVPSWAVQMHASLAETQDSRQQLYRTSTAAIAALEAEGTRLRQDAEEARDRGDRDEALELEAEANRFSLPSNATPHQREQWIDEVENYSRRVLLTKGTLAFFLPSSPQIVDVQSLRSEYIDLLEAGLDNEEAVSLFLMAHPEGLPFTISGTDDETLARPQPTQDTLDFIQAHGDWMQNYPRGSAWFLPQSDDQEEFNRRAWIQMQKMGMRRQLTSTEFYDQLAFAAGAMVYFPRKEAIEYEINQLPDGDPQRDELERQWREDSLAIRYQFPIFASQLEAGSSSDREGIYGELRMALDDPNAPLTPQTEAMRQMADGFDQYQEAIATLTGNSSGVAQDTRDIYRQQFLAWAQEMLLVNPALHTMWYSLIQPLSGLASVDMDLDPSTGQLESQTPPDADVDLSIPAAFG
jgi:ElaB/YqjD/DUF883 family membrane-anchored ribosome-binding protein